MKTADGMSRDPNPIARWIDHHPAASALVLIASDAIYYLVPGAAIQLVSRVVGWIAVGLIIYSMRRHMFGFCQTCFSQPLGGPEMAKRKARHLWYHHVMLSGWNVLIMAVFVIGWNIISVLLFGDHGWPSFVSCAPIYAVCYMNLQSSRMHQWLVPWCPWCRDDGGYAEPSPVPDPSGTKISTN